MSGLDDPLLRQAMRAYVDAADRLDEVAEGGAHSTEARDVLDLAEAKSLAALTVHRRLVECGWTPPGTAGAPVAGPARHTER